MMKNPLQHFCIRTLQRIINTLNIKGMLSLVLLKQPVLHALDAIRHEPCGAVVAARKMCKEQMVVLATHFVGLF